MTHNKKNAKTATCQSVPNFLSYVFAQYYLVHSWESYHKNKKGELFIERQCSFCLSELFSMA